MAFSLPRSTASALRRATSASSAAMRASRVARASATSAASKVLLAVAGGGSLSAASRKLDMPLATVSRKISELELRLKTRLLTRSARRLSLTDVGRAYVEASKRIVEEVDEAERAAKEANTRRHAARCASLRRSCSVACTFFPLLSTSYAHSRGWESRHRAERPPSPNMLEDRIDLAVRIGELPDSSLVASRVGATRRVVCASLDLLAARGRPQKPEQLAAHDCINVANLTPAWLFVVGKKERIFPVQSRLSVTTAEIGDRCGDRGRGHHARAVLYG